MITSTNVYYMYGECDSAVSPSITSAFVKHKLLCKCQRIPEVFAENVALCVDAALDTATFETTKLQKLQNVTNTAGRYR